MPVSKDYLPIAGASGQTTGVSVYTMNQSLRFDETRNTHLVRTPGSETNRRTFTLSFWWKIGQHPSVTNARQTIFSAGSAAVGAFAVYHNHNSSTVDGLTISVNGSAEDLSLLRTFKDPSAWYHVVIAVDTTDGVSTNRIRFYVNGLRQSEFASSKESYPSVNTQYSVNKTETHYWGARSGLNTGEMFDGYLAEINFIDGLALGPENFGEFNAHDLWIPIEYSGSYGTNGYLIQGGTASALGTDTSGNDNNFANSALQTSDKITDNPTDNYATMSPNANPGGATLNQGNLKATMASGTKKGVYSTVAVSSGKWYVEGRLLSDNTDSPYAYVGIEDYNSAIESGQYIGRDTYGYSYDPANGGVLHNNSYVVSSGSLPTLAQGDIVQIAVDLDNNYIYWGKNGTFLNSGNPASGSSGTGGVSVIAASSQPSGHYHIGHCNGTGSSGYQSIIQWNFGQDGTFAGGTTAGGNTDADGKGNFKYSVPTGYRALRIANLY